MKELTLKLKHHFDAAHKLEAYSGPCASLHGHRWNVTVYAKGTIKENNMLIDFTKIKAEINKLDHNTLLGSGAKELGDFLKQYYNQDVVYISDNPTAENIAIYLLNKFEVIYPDDKFKVQIYESPDISIEVRSDDW